MKMKSMKITERDYLIALDDIGRIVDSTDCILPDSDDDIEFAAKYAIVEAWQNRQDGQQVVTVKF